MIDAPRLEGWITLPDAADLLGVSSQAVHKMTRGSGALASHVRRIELPEGESVRDERRVVLVVAEAAVRAQKAQRDEAVRNTEELLAAS